MTDSFEALFAAELSRRAGASLLRSRRIVLPIDAVHVEIAGRRFVNFSSNNYLGLSHHPRIIRAMQAAAEEFGAGSAAAGLITGHTPQHAATEQAIARWKQTESAILLPSGYQANHAIVQTLAGIGEASGQRVRFLVDKLAHASLLDAIGGSGAAYRVYPHNRYEKLHRLLAENLETEPNFLNVVVTESIFSMDGDAADLPALANLKKQYPFFLLLDEAHGTGVYGPAGAGYAAELGMRNIVDAGVITLSKAIGCVGGAVCGSQLLCDSLLNFGRAYIYSTSIPAPNAAAVRESISVMRDEPQRQERVRALSRKVREALLTGKIAPPPGDSPIIPIALGSESAAMQAADALAEAGLLTLPIRPPTVPRGTSRLRITLSCEHSDAEIELLIKSLLALPR
jgi:8-amino-7-oxononanoate synthase